MKTKEELTALKQEVETLNKKLAELTEEELEQVSGGKISIDPPSIDSTSIDFPSKSKNSPGKSINPPSKASKDLYTSTDRR